MSANITLWCTLRPVKGKEDRLREVLLDLANRVREVEIECLKYQVVEEEKEDGGEKHITFYLFERWMSQDALETHTSRSWLCQVRDTFVAEELLISEEIIQPVRVIGGFAARY